MGVYQIHGKNVKIDDEMVLLIEELNRLGLRTVSCCSGHPERGAQAQLAFDVNECTVLISKGIISINWWRGKNKK